MALPVWPSSVPNQATNDWKMTSLYVDPIATDMDGGNQRLRSRPGSNVAVVSYPLVPLTAQQWNDLNVFFRTTLGNGASRFTMPVFTGSTYETKTVQLDQGKAPQVSVESIYVMVVMTLRIFGM
jgi:hypothetical protein